MRAGRGRPSNHVRATARRALAAAGVLALVATGCGRQDEAGRSAELDSLRAEVGRLRTELNERLARDSLVRTAMAEDGDVVIALSTDLLTRTLHAATRTYLDDVRMHLRPDVVVEESEEVRVAMGPVEVTAGRWHVTVDVHRIDARLTADTVELAVADSNRLELAVPVRVEEGRGSATIDFTWDAATAASVVCRDFRVSERFEGTVAPYTERLEATLALEAEGRRIVARPRYTGERLSVRPEPTPRAWRRVREILESQDTIFRCGLALSPDELERLLRRLLRRGFRFEFPESVLRPVAMPTVLTEELTIEGREFTVAIRPVTLRLDPERLWYAVQLELIEAGGGGRG